MTDLQKAKATYLKALILCNKIFNKDFSKKQQKDLKISNEDAIVIPIENNKITYQVPYINNYSKKTEEPVVTIDVKKFIEENKSIFDDIDLQDESIDKHISSLKFLNPTTGHCLYSHQIRCLDFVMNNEKGSLKNVNMPTGAGKGYMIMLMSTVGGNHIPLVPETGAAAALEAEGKKLLNNSPISITKVVSNKHYEELKQQKDNGHLTENAFSSYVTFQQAKDYKNYQTQTKDLLQQKHAIQEKLNKSLNSELDKVKDDQFYDIEKLNNALAEIMKNFSSFSNTPEKLEHLEEKVFERFERCMKQPTTLLVRNLIFTRDETFYKLGIAETKHNRDNYAKNTSHDIKNKFKNLTSYSKKNLLEIEQKFENDAELKKHWEAVSKNLSSKQPSYETRGTGFFIEINDPKLESKSFHTFIATTNLGKKHKMLREHFLVRTNKYLQYLTSNDSTKNGLNSVDLTNEISMLIKLIPDLSKLKINEELENESKKYTFNLSEDKDKKMICDIGQKVKLFVDKNHYSNLTYQDLNNHVKNLEQLKTDLENLKKNANYIDLIKNRLFIQDYHLGNQENLNKYTNITNLLDFKDRKKGFKKNIEKVINEHKNILLDAIKQLNKQPSKIYFTGQSLYEESKNGSTLPIIIADEDMLTDNVSLSELKQVAAIKHMLVDEVHNFEESSKFFSEIIGDANIKATSFSATPGDFAQKTFGGKENRFFIPMHEMYQKGLLRPISMNISSIIGNSFTPKQMQDTSAPDTEAQRAKMNKVTAELLMESVLGTAKKGQKHSKTFLFTDSEGILQEFKPLYEKLEADDKTLLMRKGKMVLADHLKVRVRYLLKNTLDNSYTIDQAHSEHIKYGDIKITDAKIKEFKTLCGDDYSHFIEQLKKIDGADSIVDGERCIENYYNEIIKLTKNTVDRKNFAVDYSKFPIEELMFTHSYKTDDKSTKDMNTIYFKLGLIPIFPNNILQNSYNDQMLDHVLIYENKELLGTSRDQIIGRTLRTKAGKAKIDIVYSSDHRNANKPYPKMPEIYQKEKVHKINEAIELMSENDKNNQDNKNYTPSDSSPIQLLTGKNYTPKLSDQEILNIKIEIVAIELANLSHSRWLRDKPSIFDNPQKPSIFDNPQKPLLPSNPQKSLLSSNPQKSLLSSGSIMEKKYKTRVGKILSDMKNAGMQNTTVENKIKWLKKYKSKKMEEMDSINNPNRMKQAREKKSEEFPNQITKRNQVGYHTKELENSETTNKGFTIS